MKQYFFPLLKNDVLVVHTWNSLSGQSLVLAGRVRDPSGAIVPFQHRITPTSDRAKNTNTYHIGPGELISLVLADDGVTTARGQTYGRIGIQRGNISGTSLDVVLVADYIESGKPLVYPGGEIVSPLSGRGYAVAELVADPAAGSDLTYTVATGRAISLRQYHFQMNTDATAGNRGLQLVHVVGGVSMLGFSSGHIQTASLAVDYFFSSRGQLFSAVANSQWHADMAGELLLADGDQVKTSVTGLQAGDQILNVRFLYEDFLLCN